MFIEGCRPISDFCLPPVPLGRENMFVISAYPSFFSNGEKLVNNLGVILPRKIQEKGNLQEMSGKTGRLVIRSLSNETCIKFKGLGENGRKTRLHSEAVVPFLTPQLDRCVFSRAAVRQPCLLWHDNRYNCPTVAMQK